MFYVMISLSVFLVIILLFVERARQATARRVRENGEALDTLWRRERESRRAWFSLRRNLQLLEDYLLPPATGSEGEAWVAPGIVDEDIAREDGDIYYDGPVQIKVSGAARMEGTVLLCHHGQFVSHDVRPGDILRLHPRDRSRRQLFVVDAVVDCYRLLLRRVGGVRLCDAVDVEAGDGFEIVTLRSLAGHVEAYVQARLSGQTVPSQVRTSAVVYGTAARAWHLAEYADTAEAVARGISHWNAYDAVFSRLGRKGAE